MSTYFQRDFSRQSLLGNSPRQIVAVNIYYITFLIGHIQTKWVMISSAKYIQAKLVIISSFNKGSWGRRFWNVESLILPLVVSYSVLRRLMELICPLWVHLIVQPKHHKSRNLVVLSPIHTRRIFVLSYTFLYYHTLFML